MAVELIAGEKNKGETKNAVLACNDYLRMGLARSLRSLLSHYREVEQNEAPTLSLATLNAWSAKYAWQKRADLYDAAIEAEKQAAEKERQRAIAERRKAIMEEGVALDFERVERLKRLADEIESQIYYQTKPTEEALRLLGIADLVAAAEETTDREQLSNLARIILAKLDPDDPKNKFPNLWARDVKSVAGGHIVDVVRFNAALLSEFRAILDEIAKETGGRRQRTVTESIDYNKLTEEQLQRVAAGEDPIQVILDDYASSQG